MQITCNIRWMLLAMVDRCLVRILFTHFLLWHVFSNFAFYIVRYLMILATRKCAPKHHNSFDNVQLYEFACGFCVWKCTSDEAILSITASHLLLFISIVKWSKNAIPHTSIGHMHIYVDFLPVEMPKGCKTLFVITADVKLCRCILRVRWYDVSVAVAHWRSWTKIHTKKEIHLGRTSRNIGQFFVLEPSEVMIFVIIVSTLFLSFEWSKIEPLQREFLHERLLWWFHCLLLELEME